MTGRSLRGVLAVTLCVGAVLAGCGRSGESAPTASTAVPTSSPSSPTATPSPTPTPPVLPAAAKKPTMAGAEAFVRHFWDVYNYGYAARETKQLQEIAGPDCKFCKETISGISELWRSGARVEGGRVTVESVVVAPADFLQQGSLANTIIDQRASRVVEADGSFSDTSKGDKTLRVDLAIGWDGDSWLILEGEPITSPSASATRSK